MLMDKYFFQKEDLYILDQMKEFLQNGGDGDFYAEKKSLQVVLVERAVSPASFV